LLKDHIGHVDFADNSSFADLVLVPLLALGNKVRIVSGFIPSYLNRALEAVNDLDSPKLGELSVVLCLPALPEAGTSLSAVANHLASQGLTDVKAFVDLVGAGSEKGLPLKLQILVPSRGAVITRSAIGTISDPQDSSQQVGFIDELAGDDNSPIHLSRSWVENEAHVTERFEDLVHAATFDTWSEVERLQDINIAEFQSLLADPNLAAGFQKPPTQPEISFPQKTATEVIFLGLAEDDDVPISVEDDFDLIVEAVEMSDGDVDGFFEMFYGDPNQVHELEDFVAARRNSGTWRQHAAPASAEVLEIVGDRRAECWCGADYGIREGCTNFYSIDFDE
jgi:hypothetical protein